ncbi:MAG: hypothetical protein CL946_10715, partial [Ectothiorhodospiraceae bacterium]|nr:hypothetical protein [Ectothiorhodospiraceae bacterium]
MSEKDGFSVFAAATLVHLMTKQEVFEALKEIPLFSALSHKELDSICGHSFDAEYPKGTLIFQQGDSYHGFYVVLEGSVKVYTLSEDGKETIFHHLVPPQTLAEIPMFAGGGYPAHAETLERSRLLCIYKEGFLDLLASNPELALKLLAGLSRRLKTLGAQIERLTVQDVKTRLARYLLDEFDKQHAQRAVPAIDLPISKSLLA